MLHELSLLQNVPIDYGLLGHACEYYKSLGYTQVEVPWVVPAEYSRATSPTSDDGIAFILRNGEHLVCSAEQGFIALADYDVLEPGKVYFSVSPCFRDEILDRTHSKWFMKLELFSVSLSQAGAGGAASKFVTDAFDYFIELGVYCRREMTSIGVDLMAGDLEIGSYGTRKFKDKYIAYGTGAALPRLQVARGL